MKLEKTVKNQSQKKRTKKPDCITCAKNKPKPEIKKLSARFDATHATQKLRKARLRSMKYPDANNSANDGKLDT